MIEFATWERAVHERTKLVVFGRKAKMKKTENGWSVYVETEEPKPVVVKSPKKENLSECCEARIIKNGRYFCESCDKETTRNGKNFGSGR